MCNDGYHSFNSATTERSAAAIPIMPAVRAKRARCPQAPAATTGIGRIGSRLGVLFIIALISSHALPANATAQQRGREQAQEDSPDHATWWDRTPYGESRHYRIKTDLPADEARELAEHLDRIHDAMHRQLGSLPARRPVTNLVLVFKHHEDYLSILRSRFGVNAIGTGGMFFVRPEGAAIAVWIGHRPRQRILSILQHEAFHQFAYSRFGGDLPVWANEGLAMLFEEAVLLGRELIIGEATPRMVESVLTALEQDRTIPFENILTMSSGQWAQAVQAGSATVQYHQAWSIVQFLIKGDGGRYVSAFERYLRLINTGVRADRAFLQAFETERYDLIEAAWKRYMTEDVSPSPFITAIERIEFLAEGLLELSRRGAFRVDDDGGDADQADEDGRDRRRNRRGDRRGLPRTGPETLDELRKALINIDFTITRSVHGAASELSAENAALFTIPDEGGRANDDESHRPRGRRNSPEFVLSRPRLRLRSHRERLRERENPTPPIVETRHLQPHSLRIEWKRDEETNELSYEIVVE